MYKNEGEKRQKLNVFHETPCTLVTKYLSAYL